MTRDHIYGAKKKKAINLLLKCFILFLISSHVFFHTDFAGKLDGFCVVQNFLE